MLVKNSKRSAFKWKYLYLLGIVFLLINPYYSSAKTCTSIDYSISTIAASGGQTIGLKENGTIVGTGWGFGYYADQDVSKWTNIKSIASGGSHIIGLKEDGTVIAVGDNSLGQLNVSSWSNIKAIVATGGRSVGVKKDGTVVAAGYDALGYDNISNWTNIKAVALGTYHTIGLKEDGTVVAVGLGWWGDSHLKVSNWTNIKAIATGGDHTVGLREDGTVVAVGRNDFGQLNVSNWTNIKAISAAGQWTLGLKEDGTVVAVGMGWFGQLNVSNWTNIKAIAAGGWHTVGVRENGTVVAVGDNWFNQLNVSNWTDIRQPSCLDQAVSPPSSVVASDTPCDNGRSISLTWILSQDDPAVGEGSNKVIGYNVYKSETAGGAYSLIGNVVAGTGNFTDNSAADGISYYYIVKATDGTKESADSNEAFAASMRNLPLSPTDLIASDTPHDLGGSITLNWIKSADDGSGLNNVAGYDIYRYSLANGNISVIVSLPAGSTGYIDGTTSDADTYYYFTKAVNNSCNMESVTSYIAEGRSINNLSALPGSIRTLPGNAPQVGNSLIAKAENAVAAFERGNITAAANMLSALLKEISAQSGKGIEPSTVQTLTSYVQNLITYINAH